MAVVASTETLPVAAAVRGARGALHTGLADGEGDALAAGFTGRGDATATTTAAPESKANKTRTRVLRMAHTRSKAVARRQCAWNLPVDRWLSQGKRANVTPCPAQRRAVGRPRLLPAYPCERGGWLRRPKCSRF